MGYTLDKAKSFRQLLDKPGLTVAQKQRATRLVKHYTAMNYAYSSTSKVINEKKLLKGKRPDECLKIVKDIRVKSYCLARSKLDGDKMPPSSYVLEFSHNP